MSDSVELHADLTADGSNLFSVIREAMSSLVGLQGALDGLSGGSFLGAAVSSAASFQDATVQLSSAVKLANTHISQATNTTGYWATVTAGTGKEIGKVTKEIANQNTKISEHNQVWAQTKHAHGAVDNGLISLNVHMGTLQGKLAEATATQKIWVSGMEQAGPATQYEVKALLDLADSLESVTRFGDDAIVSVERMLVQTAHLSGSDMPKATEAVLDLSTALGIDATGQAKQFAKALADPAKGVAILRREGIMLSEEQQREIRTTERLGDLHKAQRLLLEDVAAAYGGAARGAGTTYNGALDILKNTIDNFMRDAGSGFLPVLTALAHGAANFVTFLQPIAPALGIVALAFTAVTLASTPLVAGLLTIAAPIAALVAVAAGLKLVWDTNFLGLKDAVQGAWNAVQGPISLIKGAVQGVIDLLFGGDQKQALPGMERGFQGYASDEQTRTRPQFAPDAQIGGFRANAGTANRVDPKGQESSLGERLSKAVKDALPKIQSAIGDIGRQVFTWATTELSKALTDAINSLGLGKVNIDLGKMISGAIGKIQNAAGALLKPFTDDLIANGGDILQAAFDVALKAVGSWLSSATGSKSLQDGLSGIVGTLAAFIGNPGAGGAQETFKLAFTTAFDGAVGWIKGNLGALIKGAINTGLGILKTWADSGGEGFKLFVVIGKGLLGAMTGAFGAIGDALVAAIKAGLRAVIPLLRSMGSLPFVGGVANSIADTFEGIAGKASGGPVSGGTTYLVGERGPEIFTPGGSGTIIPNHQLGSRGGGAQINIQNIHVHGVQDARSLLQQLQDEAGKQNLKLGMPL